MHILLLILKIIGIAVLAILGLILFVVLLLLCSPLGYSATGCYHSEGNKKLLGNIHYLFHGLKLDLMWNGERVKYRLKLLGFQLKKGSTALADKSEAENIGSEAEDEFFHETLIENLSDVEETLQPVDRNQTSKPESVSSDSVQIQQACEKSEQEIQNNPEEPELETKEDAKTSIQGDSADSMKEKQDPEEPKTEEKSEESEPASESEASAHEDAKGARADSEPEKSGKLDRVYQLVDKVKAGYELITQPSMIKLKNRLLKRVIKLMKHVLPRSLEIKGEFGLDDPALMGKIMEAYAFLYAFWDDHFEISTDFERQHIDVKGRIKGRIIPIYLVHQLICMAIAVLLQKDARRFIFKKVFHKGE